MKDRLISKVNEYYAAILRHKLFYRRRDNTNSRRHIT